MDREEYNKTVTLAARRLEYFGRLGLRYVPFPMPAPHVSEVELALKALQSSIKACEVCDMPLKKANAVVGEGSAEASIVFVVGAPKVATVSGGSLMQSRDMELLQKIIKAMELDFDGGDVYITAIVKCVSPSDRRPEKIDIKRCLLHLNKELELISPKVIVALGSEAAEMIVPRDGDPKYKATYRGIKVVPVAHPSDMNRRPELKAGTWKELQGVMEFLKDR